jgi:tetratricopeptide (TPR) repeat protein
MRALLICVLLLVCAAAEADTPPAVKEQLRKLSRLPTVSLQLKFGLNSMEGLLFEAEDVDPEVEVANLRKSMKGTPDDAQRYCELAKLLSRLEPGNPAGKEALDKSIELFRKRIEAQPTNCQALAEFGEALHLAGRDDEAESVLRNAVRTVPDAWQPWLALAGQLQASANTVLLSTNDAGKNSAKAASNTILQSKPSPDQIERAQKLMAESMTCFDKAVAAAPTEPMVYERRGAGRCTRSSFEAMLKLARGEETNTTIIASSFLDLQAQVDFRKAVELNPRNYRTIGAMIMMEVMGASSLSGKAISSANNWESMPEESKNVVREGMTRLQKLGEDPDKKVAAGAIGLEGTMRFVILGDAPRSEASLRRAIELNPARDKCWEMLMAMLAISGQNQELADLCEQRVKRKDNAENRFLLAKARERLGQFDRAETQLQTVLKTSPDYINALGGMAALLLKHDDLDSLRQAALDLKRAEDLVAKLRPEEQKDDLKSDLLFTHALYNGLTGETESARKLLREILNYDKEYEGAQTALDALGRQ